MRRVPIPALGVVILVLATGACSKKATEPFRDAPVSGHNDGRAEIINMPDGFNNIASKCDGPNRVYSIYHADSAYGAVAVAPNDPRCTS